MRSCDNCQAPAAYIEQRFCQQCGAALPPAPEDILKLSAEEDQEHAARDKAAPPVRRTRSRRVAWAIATVVVLLAAAGAVGFLLFPALAGPTLSAEERNSTLYKEALAFYEADARMVTDVGLLDRRDYCDRSVGSAHEYSFRRAGDGRSSRFGRTSKRIALAACLEAYG